MQIATFNEHARCLTVPNNDILTYSNIYIHRVSLRNLLYR